ncbi:uncharacterized protein LOC105434882 [Cucumis sativus]|uniref:Uncharacterized protein n=1 Tax=Cucumis sativus TaxID=3659 RepID=A0A0A0L711_CUCSA|nr:uncharacterized protein LOC105434882 [Cucumis sativus]KGN57780.1 hypothetical protein Csa_009536 [Cucumis sativus]
MATAPALMIPAAMAMMLMMLIPTACGGALTSFKPLNNHTSGGLVKYMVEEEDIKSNFVMESHISRMLADSQDFETSSTNNATQVSAGECDRPPRYDSCLGVKRNTPPPQNCSTFNREHPC